jgi:hypothetical protein
MLSQLQGLLLSLHRQQPGMRLRPRLQQQMQLRLKLVMMLMQTLTPMLTPMLLLGMVMRTWMQQLQTGGYNTAGACWMIL